MNIKNNTQLTKEELSFLNNHNIPYPFITITNDKDSEYFLSFYNTGNIAAREEKHELALGFYKHSLEYKITNNFGINYASAYNNIATSYKMLNDYDNAEKYYLIAYEYDKNYIIAILRLAMLMALKDDKKTAFDYYKRYIALGGEINYAKNIMQATTYGGQELLNIINL